MTTKIESKIVAYEVVKPTPKETESNVDRKQAQTAGMYAMVKRPVGDLQSITRKIKPSAPYSDAAMYLTLGYITNETGRNIPVEFFINSKDLDNSEWVVAVTRLVSAIFRVCPDVVFVCEELRSIGSPNGGFFAGRFSGLKGGRHYNSLVAAIGSTIEDFLKGIGYIAAEDMSEYGVTMDVHSQPENNSQNIDEAQSVSKTNFTRCPKCQQMSFVHEGGCSRCRECGYDSCEKA